MQRRTFVSDIWRSMAAGCLLGAGPAGELAAMLRGAPGVGGRPLRDRAAAKGLFFGVATTQAYLVKDPPFAARVLADAGMLVPETELKWFRVHPTPDHYEFAAPDAMLATAAANRMLFRGHALVYYQTEPEWVAAFPREADVESAVREHIRNVAGHYAGRMHSWDVVNEALELGDKRPDGLRVTPLLRRLGPEYIPLAFQAAADADPHALLCWNENNVEYGESWQESRRTAWVSQLEGLKARGVPLHAVGIQSHLAPGRYRFDEAGLRNFLHHLGGLGLRIIISELDVFDALLPLESRARDQAVADAYTQYLSVALDEPAVTGVVVWGLSDRYTWLQGYHPRTDGGRARPLLLDADLKPKPAYDAVARAFDAAPARAGTSPPR